MTRPAIIINELDAERIDRLLEQPAFANSPVADALNEGTRPRANAGPGSDAA
ncbi:Regulator of nucleoside diphosphate kinase [Klebsiella pneumoniae subsp. ozaenae]|uniref:Regulator of nucleoside diphosphate kinase n=1 Tax=Klebsiella pneumoniae subsp. ozaenae TaxID=574 RepID=A0A377Z595_KLEPO|nr:Regulator of nucleoside diphosphate kinase [Klebsiella pneumoniae subsp. ozaenae]